MRNVNSKDVFTLDATISSTSHKDKVIFSTTLLESLAKSASKRHIVSQSRSSSAFISPVEQLLDRIKDLKENYRSRQSRALSTLRCGVPSNKDSVREGTTTMMKEVSYLFPQIGNVFPDLSFQSLLRRYSLRL